MKFIKKIISSPTPPIQNVIRASDGINLAYTTFAVDKPISSMIFLHGRAIMSKISNCYLFI